MAQNVQADMGKVIIGRTATVLLLKRHKLSLDWVRKFPLEQLISCCWRMDTYLPDVHISQANLQRELIQNPAFAAWFAQLLALFSNEPETLPATAQTAAGHSSPRSYPAQWTDSRFALLATRLCDLLDVCWAAKRDLTTHPAQSVIDVLKQERLNNDTRLIFLENFAPMELSDKERKRAVKSLLNCVSVPLDLSEEQKWLLCEPFVATQPLFSSAKFEEIWALLESCPDLQEILQLLHRAGIKGRLGLKEYKSFTADAPERYRLLKAVIARLEPEVADSFVQLWQRGGCSLSELQKMERRMTAQPELDWAAVFANYSGYINLLYGAPFKSIDLSAVPDFQEDVLIYAITHGKKRFIRLVDENAGVFRSLAYDSILFQRELYEEHFNLNELTARDLSDCAWMKRRNLPTDTLPSGRRYTFPELRALYNAPAVYVSFYHLLTSGSQDHRLRVFRQVLKRGALSWDMKEAELTVLAERLDLKPLCDWRQKEFAHIADLADRDTVQLLIHFDTLRHLLPDIRTRTDAMLVLQNLESLEQLDSVAELKTNLIRLDSDWRTLAKDMGLSQDFQVQHEETIVSFLCNNGAHIARTYLEELNDEQCQAFQRVVKAELMGQLAALKYFDGDLQRELDLPLAAQVKDGWRKNLNIAGNGMEVREHDDFFATMLLGVQPQRTCLAYDGGAYSHCLLSSFDSNKKVLYAEWNGHIVGRAFLRLTKGRLSGAKKSQDARGSDFTFVDLEDIPGSRFEDAQEHAVLFLERPYISGVGPDKVEEIKELLVGLACRKADELGIMLALSRDYCGICPDDFAQTLYSLYISKSKAGAQYLDSLGGAAAAREAGCYSTQSFLLRKCTEEENILALDAS